MRFRTTGRLPHALFGINLLIQTTCFAATPVDLSQKGGFAHVWNYNGRQIIGTVGTDICLWDASDGHLVRSFVGHEERIQALQLSMDGRLILSNSWAGPGETNYRSKDTSVRVWDVSSGKLLWRIDHQANAQISPDGRMVASLNESYRADRAAKITIWDATTGREEKKISPEPDRQVTFYNTLSFSPDSSQLLYRGTRGSFLFDAKTGKELGLFKRSIWSPEFRRPKDDVATPVDGIVRWNARYGQGGHEVPISGDNIPLHSQWSNDGNQIVTVSLTKITALNLETGRYSAKPWDNANDSTPEKICISGDDQRFLVELGPGPGGKPLDVRLFDMNTGAEIKRMNGVSLVGFSPDGKTFFVEGLQCGVYDSKTGKVIRSFLLSE